MQQVQLSREEHTGMHWEERPNKMCVCVWEREGEGDCEYMGGGEQGCVRWRAESNLTIHRYHQ
jgi:hypothetical protein